MSVQGASPAYESIAQELSARLASGAPSGTDRLIALIEGVHALIARAKPTEAELHAALRFFNGISDHSDARRQEWVLLADALGISELVRDLNQPGRRGTPQCLIGPFYRRDAPLLALGESISLDGKGEPMAVSGTVTWVDGSPVPQALIEVWQANHEGRYENQEPDLQPEYNLRGCFHTDKQGRFHFATIRPKGYSLPEDGPVGHLFNKFGYRLERPAHLSFRISATGAETLVTAFFDHDDQAIGRDALFAVKPELLIGISAQPGNPGWQTDISITLAKRASPEPYQAMDAPVRGQTE